jgi:hypothetical protein
VLTGTGLVGGLSSAAETLFFRHPMTLGSLMLAAPKHDPLHCDQVSHNFGGFDLDTQRKFYVI